MNMAPDTATEVRAVEASLGAWHRALESHDWIAVTAGLTPGFLMIEHDRIMDKASLLAMVKASAGSGRQRALLRDFRTEVSSNCAWTTVRNDERWIGNDGAERPFSFLETVIFRFERGSWQIDRYHATRLTSEVD